MCYDPGVQRIAVLGCLLSVCVAATAAAAPQVEIRAQTKLVLDKVRLVGDDGAEVRGQLLDNLTGEGLGGQVVMIKIGDQTAPATTNADGRFHTMIPVTDGQQTVELEYRGTTLMAAAKLSQLTDPARAQVALTLDVQEAPGGLEVAVLATANVSGWAATILDTQSICSRVAVTAAPPASVPGT